MKVKLRDNKFSVDTDSSGRVKRGDNMSRNYELDSRITVATDEALQAKENDELASANVNVAELHFKLVSVMALRAREVTEAQIAYNVAASKYELHKAKQHEACTGRILVQMNDTLTTLMLEKEKLRKG